MYFIEYQANKIVKPCYFPILLWQLALFRYDSWRIFIVTVGAFSLWQLALFRCGSWRFFVVAVGGIISSDTPLHNR